MIDVMALSQRAVQPLLVPQPSAQHLSVGDVIDAQGLYGHIKLLGGEISDAAQCALASGACFGMKVPCHFKFLGQTPQKLTA